MRKIGEDITNMGGGMSCINGECMSNIASKIGENILNPNRLSISNISSVASLDNDMIILNGSMSDNVWQPFLDITLAAGTYTFSFGGNITTNSYLLINNESLNVNDSKTITLEGTSTIPFSLVLIADTYDNKYLTIKLEEGNKSTPYVPYIGE